MPFPRLNPTANVFTKIETFSGNDTISTIFSDDFENNNISEWKQTTDWEVSASEKISGTFSLKHSSKATSGNSAIFHTLPVPIGILRMLSGRSSLKMAIGIHHHPTGFGSI